MVPIENPLHGGYGYYGFGGCGGDLMSRVTKGYEYCCNPSDLANSYCSGLVPPAPDYHHRLLEFKQMAEDESRTASSLNDAAASSSIKDAREDGVDDEGWLKLSIGPISGCSSSHDGMRSGQEKARHVWDSNIELSRRPVNPVALESCGELVELDLFPPSNGGSEQPGPGRAPLAPVLHGPPSSGSPFNFFQFRGSTSSSFPHSDQEIRWAFRPSFFPSNIFAGSPPATSSSLPWSFPSPATYSLMPVMAGAGVTGSSSGIQVISNPRRPHSAIWFMLQASENQAREPFLRQIPKSYLRIRDGKTTVGLLMKYLVNKLGLDSESEIEIRCRGQELQPCSTLQHVRDNIWSRRDAVTSLPPPDSSSSSSSDDHHLMVLHYGRRRSAS